MKRCVIRPDDVPAYHPANHTGTTNRRLISPDTVGSRYLEVLHGTVQPNSGALRHAHPGIEQVCYVLEGEVTVEIDGVRHDMHAGDCCFFPAGVPHILTVTGNVPAKIIVIYSPPYEENPSRLIR